jgi:hypothetical protein
MFLTLVVAVLAIPVLAVVAIVMTMGTRQRIKRLEFRVAGLETRLAGAPDEVASPPKPSVLREPIQETTERVLQEPPEALPRRGCTC